MEFIYIAQEKWPKLNPNNTPYKASNIRGEKIIAKQRNQDNR